MSSVDYDYPLLIDELDQSNHRYSRKNKRKNLCYNTGVNYELDTSSSVICQHDINLKYSNIEPNTALIGKSEPASTMTGAIEPDLIKFSEEVSSFTQAFEPVVAAAQQISAITQAFEPVVAAAQQISAVTQAFEPVVAAAQQISAVTQAFEPVFIAVQQVSSLTQSFEPIFAAVQQVSSLTQSFEPIFAAAQQISTMVKVVEPISFRMVAPEPLRFVSELSEITDDTISKIELENISEPEDFYIISNSDDLVLNSKEAVEMLLNDLENVEHDEKLANFYLKFDNKIKDLTKK